MKKFHQEQYNKCAKAWFNRFYRFREKYFADGKEPDEYEQMHLDYLYGQYRKFADLAVQAQ